MRASVRALPILWQVSIWLFFAQIARALLALLLTQKKGLKMALPLHNKIQQPADPPDPLQPEKTQTVCPSCGAHPKSGMTLTEARRFQLVYRKQADEFLHGIH